MVAAMLAIGEKDFDKAQDFLDVLHRICLCEVHEIGIISQLQFTVEVSQVHYLIVRLLEAGQTSPDQLERYRKILDSLNKQPGFVEQLEFGDRLENLALLTNEMYRPYLQGGAETPLVDGVLISDWTSLNRIDWNIVYKTFNEIYDETIRKLQERVDGNKPYYGSDWFASLNEEFWTDELIAAHPHTLNYDISLSREEYSRRLGFSSHALLSGEKGDESYRRSEITRQMRYRLIRTALHLEEYFFSHGEYPEKLSAEILGVDPEDLYDPFSDRTFTYHKMSSGYKLYSWGLNGVDNEGRNYDVFPYGDDYAISIYRKHDAPARAERSRAE